MIFTEPFLSAELESSIQISPSLPDSRTLSDLVESDSIVNSVIDELNLNDYLKEYPEELDAILQGNSQLELIVKHSDPEITAEFANAWAGIIIKRLNTLYGPSRDTITLIENEVREAKEQWNTSQAALEKFLPQSRVEILEVDLSSAKNTLSHYHDNIYQRQILISDALTLFRQLDEENSINPLSTAQALSIIAIQQRISGGMMGTQFQFQGEEILGSGYIVADGKASIEGLINAVEEQIKEFGDEIAVIEQRILDAAVELESEKYMVEGNESRFIGTYGGANLVELTNRFLDESSMEEDNLLLRDDLLYILPAGNPSARPLKVFKGGVLRTEEKNIPVSDG